mgnify:CR=1 FL=1
MVQFSFKIFEIPFRNCDFVGRHTFKTWYWDTLTNLDEHLLCFDKWFFLWTQYLHFPQIHEEQHSFDSLKNNQHLHCRMLSCNILLIYWRMTSFVIPLIHWRMASHIIPSIYCRRMVPLFFLINQAWHLHNSFGSLMDFSHLGCLWRNLLCPRFWYSWTTQGTVSEEEGCRGFSKWIQSAHTCNCKRDGRWHFFSYFTGLFLNRTVWPGSWFRDICSSHLFVLIFF